MTRPLIALTLAVGPLLAVAVAVYVFDRRAMVERRRVAAGHSHRGGRRA